MKSVEWEKFWDGACEKVSVKLKQSTFCEGDEEFGPFYRGFTREEFGKLLRCGDLCIFPVATTFSDIIEALIDRKIIKKSYYGYYVVIIPGKQNEK